MTVRLRRVGVGLLVVAAFVAAGLWLARDLPRRQLERALGERLQAKVRVGRLRLPGLHRAVVERLEVRRTALLPVLESLTVVRAEAEGPLFELAHGRCERLRLEGLEAVLAPNPGRPMLGGATLEVDLLETTGARITLRTGGDTATLTLDARLRDLGRATTGQVRLAGPHLKVATLYALTGAQGQLPVGIGLYDFGATASLDRGDHLRLSAAAARATLRRGDGELTLDRPRLEASATLAEGRILVTVEPTLPHLGPTRVDLALGLDPLRLEEFGVHAAALELENWLKLLPPLPDGVGLEGLAEVEAEASPAEGLRTRVAIPEALVHTPAGPLAGAVRLAATLLPDGETVHGPVEASVELAPGGTGWRAALLPARLTVGGEVVLGARSFFAGHLEAATAAAGTAVVQGTVGVDDQVTLDLSWGWQGCDLPCLARLAATTGAPAAPAGLDLEGRLAAHGALAGPARAPTLTALATVERLRVRPHGADGAWSVGVPRATLQLAWKPVSGGLTVSLPETTAAVHLPPLEPRELQLSAEATADPAAGSFRLGRLELSSPGLGQAHVTASGGRAGTVVAHLHLDLPDLEGVRSALRPVFAPLPQDLALSGSAAADFALTVTADGTWTATGPLTFRQAGFASTDGSRVAEGLTGDLELEAAGSGTGLRVHAQGEAGGFQLLWGTLFADWSETRFGLELDLAANRPDAAPAWRWQARSALAAPGGLHLEASVDRAPARPLGWTAELTVEDLATVLEDSVRRPLAGSLPALAGLQARGAVAVRLEGTLDAAAGSVRGRLQARSVDLAGAGLELRGVDADLPLDLAWSRPDPAAPLEVSGARQPGSLHFATVAAHGVTVPATAAGLVVEADRVTLGSSLTLPLLGGEVELGELALADLLRPTRHLETSVRLHAISLAELSRALGLPLLEGSLDGAFSHLRLTPTALSVDGTGQLALFGGAVEVSNISGQDVLGRYPRLAFDARLTDIDLGQLTHTFDFGEVTGILAGEVRGCELFRGVPVRFAGQLRTVPRAGVEQRLSLKAVNNIAIVGTGSGIGLLGAGLRRFISSYPYEAFGVDMRLEEDHFLLRGLERRGDRELFLRGRLPFRLDVVNVQPGSTVSFRTMVERLRQLDFSRVRTQP